LAKYYSPFAKSNLISNFAKKSIPKTQGTAKFGNKAMIIS